MIPLSSLIKMHGLWPDPPCPIVFDDGTSPSWLQLRPYPGGGRDWFCSLCEQWAVANHLSGRRHQNRLWFFGERSGSCASSLAALPHHSQGSFTCQNLIVPLQSSAAASAGGSVDSSLVGGNIVSDVSLAFALGSECSNHIRISSLAQLSPGVVEELLALALLRLGSNVVGPSFNSSLSSSR